MTAEKILEKHYNKNLGFLSITWEQVIAAMHEYASLSPQGQMKWVRYSQRKPTEKKYYVVKHYYREQPEVVAGVDYKLFDGNFWSEDEIYKLMWLDESPSEQSGQMKEALEKIVAMKEPGNNFAFNRCWHIARTALDSLPGEGGGGWVSCDDRPLFEKHQNGNWVCTEDGDKEFIAAVPYHDKSDGKDKWWIRHCVIEDHVGMCVVCEDDNEPAGWDMSDVTHWRPLPPPPVQNENK